MRDYSEEAAREARARERELRQAVQQRVEEIVDRYGPEIAALDAMREELGAVEVPNLDDFEPEVAEPVAGDTALPWLYDSDRTYLEQIEAYSEHHNGKDNHALAADHD